MFQNSGDFKQYWGLMNYVNQNEIDLRDIYVFL